MTVDVNSSAMTGGGGGASQTDSRMTTPGAPGAANDAREYSWYRHNSLYGATGLLHVASADSAAPGTFRIGLTSSYYSGTGFLCPNPQACPTPPKGVSDTQDTLDRVGADLTLSATLLPFLEAYAGMHSHATSDNFGNPQLLQVLGDTNLGLKGFLPRQADNMFSFGGLGELRLLNGSGSVGIHTANIALRALGTIDLTNRSDPQQRIPLRFHANFGYLFDNSASIVANTEASRGYPITRIERFGLDINRVDTMFIGIGGEYVQAVVQPFAEWTIDIPSNRQGYICKPSQSSPGDQCLGNSGGFSSAPSRLTLGMRVTPWLRGLNATVGLDIGTGATSKFIEELAPQLPWNLYFGIGFAYDAMLISTAGQTATFAPQVVQLPPPPERHVVGVIIDEKSLQPIPNAIIRFTGRPLTGLVSRTDGSFETGNLEPGEYAFSVSAEGYKEGTCSANVTAFAASSLPTASSGAPNPAQSGQTVGPTFAPAMGTSVTSGVAGPSAPFAPVQTQVGTGPSSAPGSAPGGTMITSLQCVLKPAPMVGVIQGALVDAVASSAVPGARITVRDSRGREVEVQTDDAGNFRFENVPAGVVHLNVDANGYLPSATDVNVKQKGEQRVTVTLNKRPRRPNVSVIGKELKLGTQIHFVTSSAGILPDSQALLQEIAAVLAQHPEIHGLEIQGHTDDTGGAAFNKRLSQDRAEAVRTALLGLGVDSNRLSAVGYGSEKPLVPNTSEGNRAKNRRVQLVILNR